MIPTSATCGSGEGTWNSATLALIAVYALQVVDAYVDAQLVHLGCE